MENINCRYLKYGEMRTPSVTTTNLFDFSNGLNVDDFKLINS